MTATSMTAAAVIAAAVIAAAVATAMPGLVIVNYDGQQGVTGTVGRLPPGVLSLAAGFSRRLQSPKDSAEDEQEAGPQSQGW